MTPETLFYYHEESHDGKKKLQGFIDISDVIVACMEKGTHVPSLHAHTLLPTRAVHPLMRAALCRSTNHVLAARGD